MSFLGGGNQGPRQGPNPWIQYGVPLAVGAATSAIGSGGRMTGQVVQGPQMPGDITGLRGDVISWLRGMGQTPNTGGMAPPGSVTQQGGFGGMGTGPIFSGGTGGYTPPATDRSMIPSTRSPLPYGAVPTGVPSEFQTPSPAGGANPGSPYSQIFAGPAQTFSPATVQAAQMGALPGLTPTSIGPVGQAGFTPGAATSVGSAGQFLDPRFNEILANVGRLGSDVGFAAASAPAVRSVADIGSVAGMSHNLADIVNSQGVNGYFKDNVLSPYRSMFDTERALALAQAKEASGNLTGSGYANTLGGTVNRMVPQQEAQLADILTSLAQGEQARQLQVAGLEQGRNIQNQQTDLQRALADASNATSAGVANAGASASLAGDVIRGRTGLYNTFANIFGDQASDQARRADQVGMFNVDQANQSGTQQAIANANAITQRAIAQGQIDASQAQSLFDAAFRREMENTNSVNQTNQFNAGQYNTTGMFNTGQTNATNQFNANQYLGLLNPLLNGGVGMGQQSYQPGAVDAFSQFLPYLMQMWGRNYGTNSGTPTPGTNTPTGTMVPTTMGVPSLGFNAAPYTWNPYRWG